MYIFADNCGGQNKNRTVIAGNLRLIHCKYFERIEMSYLVSGGHSYMACDRAFGVIETAIANSGLFTRSINDYYRVIGSQNRKIKFPTVIMQREDCKDYEQMFTSKKVMKCATTGKQFSNAASIIVTKDYPTEYLLKAEYGMSDEDALKVSLVPGRKDRRARELDLSAPVNNKYIHDIMIQKQKLQDIEHLCQNCLVATGAKWLLELIERQKALAASPNEDEPSPDDHLLEEYEDVRFIPSSSSY